MIQCNKVWIGAFIKFRPKNYFTKLPFLIYHKNIGHSNRHAPKFIIVLTTSSNNASNSSAERNLGCKPNPKHLSPMHDQMLLRLIILKFEYTPLIRIDNMRILIPVITLIIPPVGQVHMPVQEKLRAVFLHQLPENLEPLMREITPVIELIRGRMRH